MKALRWVLLLAYWLGLAGSATSDVLVLKHKAAAGGAAAFDAVSSGKCVSSACTGGSKVLTYSHTTGAGANRAMAVGVCITGDSAANMPATSSVTYAGVGLVSKHKRQVGTTKYYCELWSLPDGTQPTSGANNVIVTLAAIQPSASDVMVSIAVTATGVDQTTAWTSSANGNDGTGTSATLTITGSGANDLGVHFACNGTSVSTTVGAGETSRTVTATDTGGACNTMGGATAVGADTAFSRTVGNDSWIIIGGALKAAP